MCHDHRSDPYYWANDQYARPLEDSIMFKFMLCVMMLFVLTIFNPLFWIVLFLMRIFL